MVVADALTASGPDHNADTRRFSDHRRCPGPWGLERVPPESNHASRRHARAYRGHPRLSCPTSATSPAMTLHKWFEMTEICSSPSARHLPDHGGSRAPVFERGKPSNKL